jgi:uncharacterized SAM-binding protein YcdF (DUF218 family)
MLAVGFITFLLTIINLFMANMHFGFILLGGFSCFCLAYGVFFEKLIKIKWLTYSILTAFTLFLGMALFVGFYGANSNVTFDEDAVIVHGAGIRGESVTRILAYRLDKAVEYAERNPNAIIIVSGGQGPGEYITEALAMERYLIKKGVSEERIIKEELSVSTYENLLYSKVILDGIFDNRYRTVIITNNFHIYRAVSLAKGLGLDVTHNGAKIDLYSAPLNYSRECVAIFRMWIFGR